MRLLVVMAGLGWLLSLPLWAAMLVFAIASAALVAASWLRRPRYRSAPIQHHQAASDGEHVAALEAVVAQVEAEIDRLRSENENIRALALSADIAPEVALYRRVGLSPAAPAWLVQAAQRAYRARLHPDRHPPQFKQAAEQRFKAAEAVFAEIGSLNR
jgi:hypothetical protein